ncbi:YadA-like family protein [Escherichia fergusonii]|uniref:YadA-like family protein n=1 Tax=Escherichia fergusonii TaxID=564 RepID=UPI0015E4DCAF|nr:YadA-like family protein [Escherichia fergusonii]EHG7567374.1 adhesin [Escherichia fergusonii]QLM10054.1 YadA-like family protein [Escherichia fergusonii]QLM14646.1 YadA-like family protein [Escherichia fergusonii]QLM19241.1 YadA-like family protein [Escherichia fergusonii]QMQ72547.1 YadA-like family protein [Escherichia fergusonii]
MNKIFKVIWNPATGSYSVASETAKSRGKKSGRRKLLASALIATSGILASFGALANAGNDTGTSTNTGSTSGWIAIGTDAIANDFTGPDGASTALGYKTQALGQWGTAIGALSESSGAASTALGVNATASGNRTTAIGASANSSGEYSIAMGVASKTFGKNSSAFGYLSTTGPEAEGSLALGYKSNAGGQYSVAMGAAAIANGKDAIAAGRDSAADGTDSLALGRKSHTVGVGSIAMGAGSTTQGDNTIALGVNSFALGNQSLSLGTATQAKGVNSTALGNASLALGDSSLAIGDSSEASDANTIALGKNSNASKVNSIALGSNSDASGDNAVSLGESSFAGGTNSLALGSQSSANGNNSVALGAGSVADIDNTVSVGNSTTQRQITNMAAGEISTTSTDAINGSQLYTISKSVADRLGSGASVNANGTVNAPSYKMKSGTYNNVGEALSGIDNDTLHWDKSEGAFSASYIVKNADGTIKSTVAQNKIINVADGTISATSTDAVNGSQLKTTNDTVAANTTNIATNTTNITNLTDAVDSLGDDSLLWSDAAKAFSAAHGTEATSKITNVTAGDLTAGSTDAVNGSQLKTTNDTVAANTTNIATNTTNITNLTDAVDSLGDDSLLWSDAAKAFSAAHGTLKTASKITNVANGDILANSSDAINGSQLYSLADSFTTYLGGGADISDTGALTGPTYTIGSTKYYNVGDALNAINSSFSTSLGDALLWDATAKKFSAMHDGKASVITNVSDGAISENSSDAVNGSQLYDTSKYIADVLGGDAEVNADGTITAPTYTIANADYDNVGEALEAIDTTLDDALLWDATANGGKGAFSAGRGVDNTASKITNVANGAISAASSDAINGSQLYTTNKYIADALGGDAEVNADGTITAPTYTIANAEYNNIGDALDALDDNALLWDATDNDGKGAYSASHDGKASIITNVADGYIGEGSTDAVNGSQLNAANLLIEQNSQIINQLAGNTNTDYIENNGAGINYVRTNDTGLTFTDASAAGIGSTAVGYNSVAKGDSSVAIGQGSYSDVDTGIALGSSSVSKREIVKGSRDTSVSEEGVVIGYDTTDGELLGALSIGDDGKYRQIINVADGSEAHDAVTVRQLQNAIGAVATTPTKYFHANSTEEDSLAVGTDSLAMGAKTIVNGDKGIGIGYGAYVEANALNGIAIGSNAQVIHVNSIAIGNGSTTTRGAQTNYTAYNMDAPQNSVGEFSVGNEDGQRQITNVAAGSADTDAVNVGQLKVTDERVAQNTQSITNLNTQVTNLDTRVTNIENGIGDIVTTGSTKYFKTNTDGVDANAQGKDSVAIGSGSIAAADNSVALGTGSVATEENTISVGSSTNQRRITNVAAGKNDTDAVNVAQLKSSEAGGVRYDTKADGSVDYSNITLGGGSGGTTRISNVSAGVNNNDAVNYAQLKQSVQENKQYTDQRMAQMDHKLSKTESKLSGGIASAMAMTGLPQAYEPGANMASIGGGTYNGESAVALGVSMVSDNGRWVYKLQGSTNSQGDYSAAIGAGIQW